MNFVFGIQRISLLILAIWYHQLLYFYLYFIFLCFYSYISVKPKSPPEELFMRMGIWQSGRCLVVNKNYTANLSVFSQNCFWITKHFTTMWKDSCSTFFVRSVTSVRRTRLDIFQRCKNLGGGAVVNNCFISRSSILQTI